MRVKMCGLRREIDITYANEVKPDYVGFIFAESKRKVSLKEAINLRERLDSSIKLVGVFVNEPIEQLVDTAFAVGLDVIQLHGDENQDYISELKKYVNIPIWKAIRVQSEKDIEKAKSLDVDTLLFDAFAKNAYGGTGNTIPLELAKKISCKIPFFIAGGLMMDNLEEIIETIQPTGIDISSGIETDGYKDLDKMKKVMNIIGGKYE